MSAYLLLSLLAVYATQILTVLIVRYGGKLTSRKSKLLCFAASNAASFVSLYFYTLVFKALPENVNLASALITGGTFVSCQLALWAVFRDKLTLIQLSGIVLATIGLFLVALAP